MRESGGDVQEAVWKPGFDPHPASTGTIKINQRLKRAATRAPGPRRRPRGPGGSLCVEVRRPEAAGFLSEYVC